MLSNLLYTDPHGQMRIRIQETYLYVDPCGSGSETLGDTRVDTRVSFVQNSREFQAKRILYLAKKSSLLPEILCFAKLAVEYESQFRMFCISRNKTFNNQNETKLKRQIKIFDFLNKCMQFQNQFGNPSSTVLSLFFPAFIKS